MDVSFVDWQTDTNVKESINSLIILGARISWKHQTQTSVLQFRTLQRVDILTAAEKLPPMDCNRIQAAFLDHGPQWVLDFQVGTVYKIFASINVT